MRFHAIDPPEDAGWRLDFSYADLRMDCAAESGLLAVPHLHLAAPSRAALDAQGLTLEEARRLGLTDPRVAAAVRGRLTQIVSRYRRHPALRVYDRRYAGGEDALTGEPVPAGGAVSVALPERSGRWLRLVRA